MADYPSKHSGKTIDDAVDKIGRITEAQINFLKAANEAKNGIFYKNENGELSIIPLPNPTSFNGSMYIENGSIKVGKLPDSYQTTATGKKAIITPLYSAISSVKTTSGSKKKVSELEIHGVVCGGVTQLRVEFKIPTGAKTLKGNFGDICIAEINKLATQFSVLGLTTDNLIPLCDGLLHPGGGKNVVGYVSSSTGRIYLSASLSELKPGDKVVLGTTFISSAK